ncbi:hypothetical protein [uncultured Pelagimonas sp.]|uniref:hypothetical protein n=1 Tax=uncultured Pelagimonas sp. TaxID=1618102 RepID=UPI00261DF3F6|nr:hypothetical protein [uncultured Pelagimonas sp.]
MSFFRILIGCLVFFAPHLSHAEVDFTQPKNLTSIAETPLDLEELRYRMENLERYVRDDGLELLIGQTNYDIDLDEHLIPACGQTAELAAIFDKYGHLQDLLLADETEVFTTCIRGVFSFSDNQLPFEGYGFLKRFDASYVERVAKLAYLCGYRTDESLSNLAFATWIQPISDVQRSFRFRCYGDRYSLGSGTPHGNFLAGADVVMDNLGPYSVFQDWEITQRYIAYRNIVLTNRERLICEDDIETPLSNEFSYDDKVELLRDGDCF